MNIENPALPNEDLLTAIFAKAPVSGYTHNFYRYPARFSPIFVREVIRQYSRPCDAVLDPFMGGGTTIVEALAMGRTAIGIDLNPLAHFVTTVKTTPLSENDCVLLQEWVDNIHTSLGRGLGAVTKRIRNLPCRAQKLWADLIVQADQLPLDRQRRFARCALLKMGQWALDCKKRLPSRKEMVENLVATVAQMIEGIRELAAACRSQGLRKSDIRPKRLLLCRSTIALEDDAKVSSWPRPKLVITSPPYPSTHILYHRWQVEGRKETSAPFWLAGLNDGHFASRYTFGSRSNFGLENYFRSLQESFRSVRQLVSPAAVIVQMVAFSNASSQLPRYLSTMEQAGYEEFDARSPVGKTRIWRKVPNRKWYCQNGKVQDSALEVVLFHRPA